ncbi:hypothetical protein GJ700_09190 [Duganella sp. FT92W]|uniref:Uncharacterized protein n=1 Tax=Pseudoduganella rivuli TaxID=2666085 RepID=A0A7X2LTI7_9BURK|nr:hypothetical protein [Pseudoduganella rivuli]MRV71894.1 hypothetical protein [Pseudoduganella rivuli]
MKNRIKELDDLIFYSIDKASPYALAQNPMDNTLDKISDLTLAQLSILPQGAAIMWLWINAHSGKYHAKPVPATIAGKVETVKQVIEAVYATIP